jgi:GDP-L-fucose synthase
MNPDLKIYVIGHRGLVGSAISRNLDKIGYTRLISLTSSGLDVRDSVLTMHAILQEKSDVVILAAVKIGRFVANSTQPVEFLNENFRIQKSVFEADL